MAVDQITRFEQEFFEFIDTKYPEIPQSIATEKEISAAIEEKLVAAIEQFKAQWN